MTNYEKLRLNKEVDESSLDDIADILGLPDTEEE